MEEFQKACTRTMPKEATVPALANYSMGLAGETGEVIDHLKKFIFHDHPINEEKVLNELGDVFHYAFGLAHLLGFTAEQVAEANMEKLRKRYPDGFSPEASINRID